MALLQITREDEYMNRLRNISIYLDGLKLGTIKNGEIKDFEIAAGDHFIKAKIDWCGSNTIHFHVAATETKFFNLCSFAKDNPLGSLATIYYISFGTNKYLKLEQIF
jgi:hypothetical protein